MMMMRMMMMRMMMMRMMMMMMMWWRTGHSGHSGAVSFGAILKWT
jgi:hypothetical protein